MRVSATQGYWHRKLIADALATFFNIKPAYGQVALQWLCEKQFGIEILRRPDLPPGTKGYHHSYRNGRPVIILPSQDAEFRVRATTLHELAEIIVETTKVLLPSSSFGVYDELPEAWFDSFAHAVLLPREWYRGLLLENGFNLPSLQERTSLSYAGIAIRVSQVCEPDIPIFALLAELGNSSSRTIQVSTWTKPWLAFAYKGRGSELFRVPRRNASVNAGSVVQTCALSRHSRDCLVLSETQSGPPREALVRVLTPRTNPAAGRVMIVGVPATESHLLRGKLAPDCGEARPISIAELW